MMYYNLFTPRAKMNALGALGLVSTVANAGFQDYTNRKNREFSQQMLQEQQRFQTELNANSALVQKQSLQAAGLSPNMLSGDPPYGSSSALGDSSSQSAPQLDVNSIVALAQMEQQKPLVDSQARQANASAEAQEIENDRQRTLDRHLDAYFKDLFPSVDPESGEAQVTGNYRTYNKGTLDAQKMEREWENRSKELDALDIQYEIDRLVNDIRLKDSKTVQAIADMPYLEKRKLYNEILNLIKDRKVMQSVIDLNVAQKDLATSQKDLNELEKRITENSNIHELITKYLGEGELADVAHFIVMLLGALTGNVRFGANLSKFSGKTKSESHNTNSNTNRNTNNSMSHSTVHHYSHNGD